ncbi:MAG: hypothetical protein HYW89_04730 [Candidatus Sungiibacteriota bacterium]|uniref:Uncharacterized protein n=1 Tax=Candidatus Sungiibacteriota bacterium TaxID=2750080 RepID=A0A7T5UQK7_9BACT|nr:MAG: hypothetical protein HYW89_04730 [Candidatus Sungbacteria bacterium]
MVTDRMVFAVTAQAGSGMELNQLYVELSQAIAEILHRHGYYLETAGRRAVFQSTQENIEEPLSEKDWQYLNMRTIV